MSNPWLDETSSSKPNQWADDDDVEDFDPNRDYFSQAVAKKEYDMVESTKRSLRMVNESEVIGAAAGAELLRQGEALKRTEKKVDQMEQDLKESDRHIASIKSIWGAFMNKFKKEPTPTVVVDKYEDDGRSNRLQNAVASSQIASVETDSYDGHPIVERQQEDRGQRVRSSNMDKSERMVQVDDNLDQLSAGLSRLKSLGIGLGEEIDSQDKVLSRLGDSVSRVDEKTHRTNKELIRLNK